MSNQNVYKSILKDYDKYVENEKIEEFQYVLESNLNALEDIGRAKIAQIKEVMNDIEYIRFLYSKNEQPEKVKELLLKLKQIIEI